MPSTARITSVSATLGAPVQSGVPIIAASSTARQVFIALTPPSRPTKAR